MVQAYCVICWYEGDIFTNSNMWKWERLLTNSLDPQQTSLAYQNFMGHLRNLWVGSIILFAKWYNEKAFRVQEEQIPWASKEDWRNWERSLSWWYYYSWLHSRAGV